MITNNSNTVLQKCDLDIYIDLAQGQTIMEKNSIPAVILILTVSDEDIPPAITMHV